MSIKTITRSASDNPYFHKDFHIALNYGIDYLYKKFGEIAVKEYLIQFAENYYGPLKKALIKKGLLAIKEHYEKIYKIEEAKYSISFSHDNLHIHLLASPAVIHIKSNGHQVSSCYHETVATVNKEICKNSPFDCEMLEYKQENGAYKLHFYKKAL